MGCMASQYPGFFEYVSQCIVRWALYLNGSRLAALPEYQSGKQALRKPVRT